MARSERAGEAGRDTEQRWTRVPRPGGDTGSVTAEAAMVLPVLVALAAVLVWALVAAADQIRCVDAARAAARAAARSEPESVVRAAARTAAPARALVVVRREGALWRVRVEAPTPGPHALALTLSAEAAALAEDTVGAGPPADPGSGADPGPPAEFGPAADPGPGAAAAPGDVPGAGERAGGGR
ncbi:TadE family type IV pilus minor pilin [Streptomyces sp. NPDC008125]|uniref:TadE family type IV pilus minor pilin n=1 Tax=Streptomyces sp. NPDC008125 TaxID=3364811 RepID=UPI0036EAD0D5